MARGLSRGAMMLGDHPKNAIVAFRLLMSKLRLVNALHFMYCLAHCARCIRQSGVRACLRRGFADCSGQVYLPLKRPCYSRVRGFSRLLAPLYAFTIGLSSRLLSELSRFRCDTLLQRADSLQAHKSLCWQCIVFFLFADKWHSQVLEVNGSFCDG